MQRPTECLSEHPGGCPLSLAFGDRGTVLYPAQNWREARLAAPQVLAFVGMGWENGPDSPTPSLKAANA